eukprot:6197754-Pleurochrysis_carterae.AAC.1
MLSFRCVALSSQVAWQLSRGVMMAQRTLPACSYGDAAAYFPSEFAACRSNCDSTHSQVEL